MTVPTRIWAVSRGEYSDYSVLAVFIREQDAHAAVTAGFGEDVEEFDLYTHGKVPVKVQRARYQAVVDFATGNHVEGRWFGTPEEQMTKAYITQEWAHPSNRRKVNTDVRRHDNGVDKGVYVRVEGPNTDRTRKVFHDLVAKTRAECIEGLHAAPAAG